MAFENLLPWLAEDPRDVRGPWPDEDAERADEVIYRLGLHALAVPGLPQSITIDDVEVEFVHGPVRAQQTHVRQRHGLPILFDKQMERAEIGDGEVLALFAIRCSPIPEDLPGAFARWRAGALAAAGMIAAVLDERVAGRELFEDAVLLHKGVFVGAADMRGQVRSYLPFEVNIADLAALEGLSAASVSETSAVARASRLYRRAALEGPTADAYAMLWVAAECFSEHSGPSRKAIEAALDQAGLDPDGLPMRIGLLIDLRGKIQHRGLDDDDRLGLAFYEMEAVVRALIRQHLQLHGGWWPASDNPAGFAEPFDHAVAALLGPGTTEWHKDGLPPTSDPVAQHLPRRVPNAPFDPRVELDPDLGEARELVATVVIDALELQEPGATLTVRVGRPAHVPSTVTAVADATTIWLTPECLERLDDPRHPEVLVNFVWDLHALVAASLAQQAGIASEHDGVALIEALGAWAQYRRLVTYGEFDASLLQLPVSKDLTALGKLAGWAAAGDARAEAAVVTLDGPQGELVAALVASLREHEPGASTEILALAARLGADPSAG